MSTEHQKYSTDNLSMAIRKYANANNMDIVGRLLANEAISSYLKRNHIGLLDQLLMLQDNIDSELGVAPD